MDNLLVTQALKLTFPEMLINLAVAMALGVLTALVYKKTHRGVSYSQSFVTSLVLVTIVTSVVIMVIGNSLARAFGLLGAFALVRFRTAVKETRDITFLFLALVLGLAAGSGAHQIAFLALLVVSGVTWVLDKTGFGAMAAYEYLLRFTVKATGGVNEPYREVFGEYLKESLLLNVRSIKDGRELELSFNVRMKDEVKVGGFTSQLGKIKGVSRVELVNTASDVEY